MTPSSASHLYLLLDEVGISLQPTARIMLVIGRHTDWKPCRMKAHVHRCTLKRPVILSSAGLLRKVGMRDLLSEASPNAERNRC